MTRFEPQISGSEATALPTVPQPLPFIRRLLQDSLEILLKMTFYISEI